MKLGQFVGYYKRKTFLKYSTKTWSGNNWLKGRKR